MHEHDVYPIFTTWVRFIALQWGEIDIWPSKELIRFYMLLLISKRSTPKPELLLMVWRFQSSSQPSPSHRDALSLHTKIEIHAAKALVGITPGGMVSFISDAFGGSTSDRQIVERSSLIDRSEYGDSIMADKGFNVQDLFESKNVVISIPTFKKK